MNKKSGVPGPAKGLSDPTDTSRLVDDLGPLWRRLYMMVIQFQEGLDLGPRGMWLIRDIARGEIYPSDLASSLVVAPSLLSAEINRLIKAEMVVKEPAMHDGRRTRLSLTPKALQLLAESEAAIDRALGPIFERFKKADRDGFFMILEALSQANLSDSASEADSQSRLRRLEAENKRLRDLLAKAGIA